MRKRGRKPTPEGATRIKNGVKEIATRKSGKIKWIKAEDQPPKQDQTADQDQPTQQHEQPKKQMDQKQQPPQPETPQPKADEGLNFGKLGGDQDNYEEELRQIFEANNQTTAQDEPQPEAPPEDMTDQSDGTTFEPEVLVLTSELSISFICSMLIKRSEMKDFYFKPEQKESLLKAAQGLDIQVQLSPAWQYILALATVTGANIMDVMKKQKAEAERERAEREQQREQENQNGEQ